MSKNICGYQKLFNVAGRFSPVAPVRESGGLFSMRRRGAFRILYDDDVREKKNKIN